MSFLIGHFKFWEFGTYEREETWYLLQFEHILIGTKYLLLCLILLCTYQSSAWGVTLVLTTSYLHFPEQLKIRWTYLKIILCNPLCVHDTGRARLIRSHSSARFCFEISEIRINRAFQTYDDKSVAKTIWPKIWTKWNFELTVPDLYS